jgi:hypothetical protein
MRYVIPFLTLLAIGCHHDADRAQQMDRPTGDSAQHVAATVDDYVNAVQRAKTPAEEADALQHLHQYESDHGLTYVVHTVRTYDNAPVTSASVANQPVRADVTIQRGRQVVKTFSFVPKDNRNLALLGE